MIHACLRTIFVLQVLRFEISDASFLNAPGIDFSSSAQIGYPIRSEWDHYKQWKKIFHKGNYPEERQMEKFSAWSNNFRKVTKCFK